MGDSLSKNGIGIAYVGKVVSIDDSADGERIAARIASSDRHRADSKIPWAYPLLPKFMHIKPKVGEYVIIICEDADRESSQRYYIGPIISQPQFLYEEKGMSAMSTLDGGAKMPEEGVSNKRVAKGAFAKDDEIAIYGRKNSDIILGDDDVRIRCGARLLDESTKKDVSFNSKGAPAFVKLKYYPDKLKETSQGSALAPSVTKEKAESVASVVGDKICLISENGDPFIKTDDINEGISDEEMIKFLNEAHELPYGDKLVHFLFSFLKMFQNHTHEYHYLPPIPDANATTFSLEFGSTEEDFKNKLLSDNILIN